MCFLSPRKELSGGKRARFRPTSIDGKTLLCVNMSTASSSTTAAASPSTALAAALTKASSSSSTGEKRKFMITDILSADIDKRRKSPTLQHQQHQQQQQHPITSPFFQLFYPSGAALGRFGGHPHHDPFGVASSALCEGEDEARSSMGEAADSRLLQDADADSQDCDGKGRGDEDDESRGGFQKKQRKARTAFTGEITIINFLFGSLVII